MIHLVSADFQKLKSEMKVMQSAASQEAKLLKKKYSKEKVIPPEVKKKLDQLSHLKEMRSHSSILPVKIAGIIINYKMYQAFMKKLNGFEYRINIADRSLSLTYWKQDGSGSGIMVLEDISTYFENFRHIPVAQLRKDAKTS